MPVASEDTSQLELMKTLLEQRGLLATKGNIRSLPFADDTTPASSASSAGTSVVGPSAGASATTRPPGETPLVKGNTLIDPHTQQPITGQVADDWWKYLIAAGVGGGGYALYKALRNRKGEAGTDIPTVEGEVVSDPLAPLSTPVEGEYSNVGDTLAKPTAAQVLADRNKQLTSRNIPRPNPVATSDTSIIRVPDQVEDISPEDLQRAKTLAAQLVANRQLGNARVARQSNLNRRAGSPTGSTDEEGLLNTIIGIMRSNGATKILPRAIP